MKPSLPAIGVLNGIKTAVVVAAAVLVVAVVVVMRYEFTSVL